MTDTSDNQSTDGKLNVFRHASAQPLPHTTVAEYIHIREFDADAFAAFDGSQVIVSNRFVMFWKPPCPFGQWTASPFDIDGVAYNCAEQYMMADRRQACGVVQPGQQAFVPPDTGFVKKDDDGRQREGVFAVQGERL